MSRRQRKNVKKREKDCSNIAIDPIPSLTCTPTSNLTSVTSSISGSSELTCSSKDPPKVQRKRNGLSSRLYVSLNLSDGQIYLQFVLG